MRNIKISKIFSENAGQIVSLLILVFALIIIDQVTKALAQKYLEHSASIEIVPSFISLHFIRNEITYVYQYIFYLMLCLVVFPAIIFYSIAKKYSKVVLLGLALVWSALISNNIIDAFFLGYIRDFITLHGVATGNIADQFRTAGLLVIVVGLVIKDEKKLSSKVIAKLLISIVIVLALLILFWKYLAKIMAI